MRRTPLALLALPLLLTSVACAPKEDATKGSASSGSSSSSSTCDAGSLATKTKGTLTVGTSKPAYDPWFSGNDPTNGKGFESAVAYAVAKQLGFAPSKVTWTNVPFNNSYAPGAKKFDFDINQISITPARQKVVGFSQGYYSAAQAVIALKKDKVKVGSLSDLAGLKLGAQTGTTSLTAIRDVIKPKQQPLVYGDTNTAKQALLNGQVDAIVTDLPTAFYISAAEISGSELVGQFQPQTGQQEEFGLLTEKGSPILSCLDQALSTLKKDGTLAAIQQKWLSTKVSVPVLK
ncbi:ABC transporter substrate-binding protein [Nocardioides korecus]